MGQFAVEIALTSVNRSMRELFVARIREAAPEALAEAKITRDLDWLLMLLNCEELDSAQRLLDLAGVLEAKVSEVRIAPSRGNASAVAESTTLRASGDHGYYPVSHSR